MGKGRLEAFSDGVIAIIIITIMVLELKLHLDVEPWGAVADFSKKYMLI